MHQSDKIIDWFNENPGTGILITIVILVGQSLFIPIKKIYQRIARPRLKLVIDDGTEEGIDTIHLSKSEDQKNYDSTVILKISSNKYVDSGTQLLTFVLPKEFNRTSSTFTPRVLQLSQIYSTTSVAPLFEGLNPIDNIYELKLGIANPDKELYKIPWEIKFLNQKYSGVLIAKIEE